VIHEPFGNRSNSFGTAPDELVVGATKIGSTLWRRNMPITSFLVTYPQAILVKIIGNNDFALLAYAEPVAEFMSEG
jgi:hypothetical protein